MKVKTTIIILLLTLNIGNIYSNDTIRYDLLKLEKIQVDTLIKIDLDQYVGVINLQFKKGTDSLINISFIDLRMFKKNVFAYKWTAQSSPANFTLAKGLYYKLQLIQQCENDINKGSFYEKYSDFAYDNCSLSRLFDKEKYKENYNPKFFHYIHSESTVYKVIYFAPCVEYAPKEKRPLDFIPIKLSK